ncbi:MULTISPECIES: hypothetical protein [unclassified Simplicispira]|jgi:hypothetical protein|uniref:hypothetical protein n=1 Tax=unclassified Simplicispira TaxID=2630407 RepID=UPI000D5EDA5C|nr:MULTISPECIES: hypothetical protein [unclassified Simplicispira]PVY56332.1 hypothetical protein C8D04_1588 [Simplicispira sp. 125]REG17277.1 hypothetical protein C8D01_1898 [Simplicispira sp. 110]
MEAVQRNQDAASRYAGAATPGVGQADNAAAYRRNASLQAETPEPVGNETTVTLSARAQQLAAQAKEDRAAGASEASDNGRVASEQMSLLNAQLRRTYAEAGGPG